MVAWKEAIASCVKVMEIKVQDNINDSDDAQSPLLGKGPFERAESDQTLIDTSKNPLPGD